MKICLKASFLVMQKVLLPMQEKINLVVLKLADGGTIFLDEIGNLSLPLQAKLLSVLQNRTVTRLGESKERKIDVRLISATNMPLNEMVAKGTFRQDLLFRINTVELLLPPLRQRGNDIVLLAFSLFTGVWQ
jgi:transcriptional regulator with PAS, ATPase and Fis domain